MPRNQLKNDKFLPHDDEARFSYWGFVISDIESCYTDKEQALRDYILKSRDEAGIPPRYKLSPWNWFDNDVDTAFLSINDDSWFFRKSLKPRDRLSIEDFRWRSIDPKSLQCPVNSIGKYIGDYLKVRNKKLAEEHLNQPMNFLLIDVMHILSGMARDSDEDQVKTGLIALQNYLNKVKMQLSATKGNDRHFLNRLVDVKLAGLINKITLSKELWVFREMVDNLEQSIDYLELIAHTKAHFSLNAGKINPHVYLPKEIEEEGLEPDRFPVMQLRQCMKVNQQQPGDAESGILEQCDELKLIDDLDSESRAAYLALHQGIDELLKVKKIIKDLKSMMDITGEVMLAFHFNQPVQSFIDQLTAFLHDFHETIKYIEHTQSHYFFKNSQNLSRFGKKGWFKQWLDAKKKSQMEQFNQNSKALEGNLYNLQPVDKLIGDALETANKMSVAIKEITTRDVPALTEDMLSLQQHFLESIERFSGIKQRDSSSLLSYEGAPASSALQGFIADIEKNSREFIADCQTAPQAMGIDSASGNPQHCRTTDYDVLILSKASAQSIEKTRPETYQYALNNCHSVHFDQKPSVLCQGEDTAAVFQARSANVEMAFAALPGQLALAYLLGKMLGAGYPFHKAQPGISANEPKFIMPQTRVEKLKDKLAKAHTLSQFDHYSEQCKDNIDFYNEMIEELSHRPLTIKEQDELEKDLDYFISCLETDSILSASGEFHVSINNRYPTFFEQKPISDRSNTYVAKPALKPC